MNLLGIQNEVSWYILFDDDIILVDETRKELASKIEKWSEILESKGYRIRTNTEIMQYNYIVRKNVHVVQINSQVIY